MTTLLNELAAGFTFDPMTFTITPEMARAYRAAVEDTLPIYEDNGLVPPLAVAALALGAMLQQVTLPGGSLHASESLEMKRPVPVGVTVECRARIAQRSQRAGWVVTVLETDLLVEGESALAARATVLIPAAAS